MKYVLLGNIASKWIDAPHERLDRIRSKMEELGITIEACYYTQGEYDFCEFVEAPSAEAMLTLSIWYLNEGYGRFQSLPAFAASEIGAAVSQAQSDL